MNFSVQKSYFTILCVPLEILPVDVFFKYFHLVISQKLNMLKVTVVLYKMGLDF